ncbi:MAG: helix-turn-helix domain-containing protein [Lachnospiraceae bacterium]
MSEEEFNKIFSRQLKRYLKKYSMTQAELAKKLGVGNTSVYNWCNGIKTPRMDKVDAMCSIFHCNRSDLMEDKSTGLTSRDNKDIKKDLDAIMERLTNKEAGPVSYDGEDLSLEAAELFKDELEIALRRLKLINKEKYNPNKNKK